MSRPIAIVGISAELPSGASFEKNHDHSSFFEFLLASGESYERIPASRLNIDTWRGLGLGRVAVDTGSFLKDIDAFDHVEFGISSRDARAMAPAARKLLEQCFLALLDSGIDYRKKRVGCYASGTAIDLTNVGTPDVYEPRGSFANAPSMLANRVSAHLDLLGPSIPIDTACSSSLTALHMAVQAILNDDCTAAVVGGCQLNHRLIDWVGYSQTGVLSPDGKCKPFDAGADGFGRAEGCVAVVLKPLEDALRDQDHIYATILGTAVNSTGASGPPGAPVAESQCEAMKIAFKRAGVHPSEVSYVEMHATGTAKGDPTEANWVGEQFQREGELLVGSVKGNIGHTEIAAFLASLSKVVSIFEHKIIPPNVNVSSSTLNPAIKWAEYNLRVPLEPTPLLTAGKSGRSLISMGSSGIGGSNGHVVLEAPPAPALKNKVVDERTVPVLLMAAGLSPRSATTVADQLAEVFKTAPSSEHPGLSTVLGRRSKQLSWRSFAVVEPLQLQGEVKFSSPQYSGRDVNALVFVFSGQGPQHEAMGRELFKTFPVFRESIQEMDLVFQRKTGMSIINDHGLFDCASTSFDFPTVWPIALTLPAIAMFQIALFDLLVYLGITPDIVLGHSAGETAVLYASGAAPKAMAVELAIIRGQIFSTMENAGGTMAALSCSATQAEDLLVRYKSTSPDARVEIACLNAPSAVALAGEESAVDAILELAGWEDIFARKIRTRVPIHSSMMDRCRERYRDQVQDLFASYPGEHVPKVRTYSTLTGTAFAGPFDAEYFWMNTRSQVLFAPTIQNLDAGGTSTFVELAPHPVLSSYLSDMTATSSSTVLSFIQRPKSGAPSTEYRDTLQFLGKLTAAGHNCVDFTTLNSATCSEARNTRLPAYPFLKKTFPLFPEATQDPEPYFGVLHHGRLKLGRDTHPSLFEHVIRGEPILPAAGFIEMALEFGATALFNVQFRAMLSLSAEEPFPVEVSLDGSFWSVSSSVVQGNVPTKRVHAEGYLSFEPPRQYEDVDLAAIRARCSEHVDSEFYPSLSYFSAYGPKFQRVTEMYYGPDEALASIRGMDASLAREKFFILHPAILDAAFQISAHRPFNGDFAPNNYYLPSSVGELILHNPSKLDYLPSHVYAHVEFVGWRPDSLQVNLAVVDDRGKRLCTLRNFVFAKHHMAPVPPISTPLQLVLQPAFSRPRDPESLASPIEDKTELFAVLDHETAYPAECSVASRELRFTAVLAACSSRLRHAIFSLAQRVVRVCISTQIDRIIIRTVEVLAEFPHLAFELCIPSGCASVDAQFAVVRQYEDEFPLEGLFDIVVAFGRSSATSQTSPDSLIRRFDERLLPGGTFILADVNRAAWDEGVPGTAWFTATFGPPHAAFHLDEYRAGFEQTGFTIIQTDYSPTSDPFHFTIDAQKASWQPEPTRGSLEDVAFVFDYVFGDEGHLQWELSGLNPSQELEIWILATEGPGAAAGVSMTRALRREYLFWKFRFVSFPAEVLSAERVRFIETLPDCVRMEPDLFFSAQGELLVPRLVPLLPQCQNQPTASEELVLPPDTALAHVHLVSSLPGFSAVAASLVRINSDDAVYQPGVSVIGLQTPCSEPTAVIDLGSTCLTKSGATQPVVDSIPGTVVALLAPGLHTWSRTHRIISSSILITHADTLVGSTVQAVYSHEGFNFSPVPADIPMLDLAQLGTHTFDLIVSGYEDNSPHVPVLKSLLKPSAGKLFLWNRELPRILRDDPCSIGEALRVAAARGLSPLADVILNEQNCVPVVVQPDIPVAPPAPASGAVFDPEKTYVLLGGIGSLGASLAMYMTQHGARHLVVTSRSGRHTLTHRKNLIARRIFQYLEGLEHLDVNLHAVDGTSSESMCALFESFNDRPLGGCFLLSGITRDGLFPTLDEEDFASVAASKTGVLKTLQDTIDVSKLDFVVAFSSVTSMFGTGGQTNYCAANGALEEQVALLSNGFSFVCPAIRDTAFMLAGGSHGSSLKHLLEWSISTDEMILWLDNALHRFQNGDRFQRYMPSLDWETMDRTHGMNKLGAHLVPTYTRSSTAAESEPLVIRAGRIIQSVLNVSEEDFDGDVPLSAYGVDSLSAGRLSFALRSLVEVTQLQLLGDNSLNDILRKYAPDASDSATFKEANGGI